MYGMVHRAARQMIIENHGEASWAQILSSSGLGDESFISANVYSDDVTMILLGEISNFSNKPVNFMIIDPL
jgi:Haem-NO-binding